MLELEYPEIFKGYQVEAFFTKKIQNPEDASKLLPFKFYTPIQKHTDNIHILHSYSEPVIADAVITNKKNLFIGIKTADCLPILIFDPQNNVIAAVHAGWRGTAKGILKKTIYKMNQVYQSDYKNLLIAFGPYIKSCCYEVGDEVIEEINKQTPKEEYILRIDGKRYIDIGIANFIQALSIGVKEENIWISEHCTHCKHDEYASYRFQPTNPGRQYGIIGMV